MDIPIALIITIAIAALALILQFISHIRGRTIKTLDYATISRVPLLTSQGNLPDSGLKVTYNDAEVKDPWISTVRIKNTGAVEVKEEDYSRPIQISARGTVLSAAVVGTSQNVLKPTPKPDSAGLAFEPKLLNKGEWFEVRLVTDGPPGALTVSSHFAGANRAMKDAGYADEPLMSRWVMTVVGVVAALAIGIWAWRTEAMLAGAIFSGVAGAGILLMVIAVANAFWSTRRLGSVLSNKELNEKIGYKP